MKKIFIILCCLACVSCAEKNHNNSVQKWADYSYVDEFPFDEDFEMKIKLDVFPDTEFIWREYEILASTAGEERVLIDGMPILNAFFADLMPTVFRNYVCLSCSVAVYVVNILSFMIITIVSIILCGTKANMIIFYFQMTANYMPKNFRTAGRRKKTLKSAKLQLRAIYWYSGNQEGKYGF